MKGKKAKDLQNADDGKKKRGRPKKGEVEYGKPEMFMLGKDTLKNPTSASGPKPVRVLVNILFSTLLLPYVVSEKRKICLRGTLTF